MKCQQRQEWWSNTAPMIKIIHTGFKFEAALQEIYNRNDYADQALFCQVLTNFHLYSAVKNHTPYIHTLAFYYQKYFILMHQ